MTGLHHCPQLLSVQMESHRLFCLGWLQISILISTSRVARITGVSHRAWPSLSHHGPQAGLKLRILPQPPELLELQAHTTKPGLRR
jgi:hypothetical protein